MLSQGCLKRPSLLSIQDLRNIYAEILKLEALEMQGQPLQQTIYTFTYPFLKLAISTTMLYGNNRLSSRR